MPLRNNLIHLMKSKSLTISKLATMTDISIASLKRLRSMECNPTLDILLKLSNALDVTVADLIKENSTLATFYQDNEIMLSKGDKEFIFIFTRDTFGFKNGTKAIFKRYTGKENLTKYIIYKSKTILERIKDDEFLFKDEYQNLYCLNPQDISGFIIKQLYEVSYV